MLRRIIQAVVAVLVIAPLHRPLVAQSCNQATPGSPAAGDWFGADVDLDGTLGIIGWPYDSNSSGTQVGAARLINVETGSFQGNLKPDPGAPSFCNFGVSVAIDDGIVCVGAPGESAVYVFDAVSQAKLFKLQPNDLQPNAWFGLSVGIDDGRVVVGAPYHYDASTELAGAAYLFDVETGAQIAKLPLPPLYDGSLFGNSVALGGGLVAAGVFMDHHAVPGDQTSQWLSAIHFYSADNGAYLDTWTYPQAKHFAGSDGLAIDGTIVAAVAKDYGGGDGLVYVLDASSGALIRTIAPTDGGDDHTHFGVSLSLDGGRVLVGDYIHDTLGVGEGQVGIYGGHGDAYLFEVATGQQIDRLTPSDGASGDGFAYSVALSGTNMLVGAPWKDVPQDNAGAVYLFDTRWLDLGHGLAGTAGKPCLKASGDLSAGATLNLTLSKAKPTSAVMTIYGTAPSGPSYLPFKGGTLVPAPTWTLFAGFTNASGVLALSVPFLPVVPSGVKLYVQDWIQDPLAPAGYAASNAISLSFP